MRFHTKIIKLKSIRDSQEFAHSIFGLITKPPFIICLYGNLGTGKTLIAGEIIKLCLNDSINITSPTFNLVNTYDTDAYQIYHYDLYRLNHIEEIYELGIDEALDKHLCIIEWPELIENILPQNNRIDIKISFKGDIRISDVTSYN